MRLFCWLAVFPILLSTAIAVNAREIALEQKADRLAQIPADDSAASICTPPVLSRLVRHTIAPGETLTSIAQRYNLIPATLMGLNPALRDGKAPVGSVIQVPPYNGIRVELKPGQTLRDVARTYSIRPGLLFEANGCQSSPKVVFVPGVNWSPVAATTQTAPIQPERILSGYPLPAKPSKSTIALNYGWGLQPTLRQVAFHSGVDLAASAGTPVLAVADGTIAFAGNQGTYGNLIVINHQEGLQTRYAQLATLRVKAGQVVKRGQTIATVGQTGRPSIEEPHLHFEVRSRSNLGWVAENPEVYLLRDLPRPNQAQK